MLSVNEWLKTIEMKKFVDDGMFLQRTITLVICQSKNSSTTRTSGGSISISRVLTPYHWENVLISSKRCLPWNDLQQEVGEEQLAPTPYWKNKQWKSAIEFVLCMVGMVRLLVVFLKFREPRKRQAKSWERTGDPLFAVRWWKPQKMAFTNSTDFGTERSFTADSGVL